MRILALLFLIPLLSVAQKPASLDHYDEWKDLSGARISNNGEWVVYSERPQQGDAVLHIYDVENKKDRTFERGVGAKFSNDSRYVVYTLKPYFDTIRNKKLDGVRKSKLPKDTLAIYSLTTGKLTKIADLKSFKTPSRDAAWLAYHLDQEPTKEAKKKNKSKSDDALKDILDAGKNKPKAKKPEQGKKLVIRKFSTGRQYTIDHVTDYMFSKYGDAVIYSVITPLDEEGSGVFHFSTKTKRTTTLTKGLGYYKQMAITEDGDQVAFVASKDTSEMIAKEYGLYYWESGWPSASIVVDSLNLDIPAGKSVSEHGRVWLANDGSKIFFGLRELPEEPMEDTLLKTEKPSVDIWNWKDDFLQPQQLKSKSREEKRSFMAVWHVEEEKLIPLEDSAMMRISIGNQGNGDWAVGTIDTAYRQKISWDGWYNDIYLVNLWDGEREWLAENIQGGGNMSTKGKYITWFHTKDQHWYCHDIENDVTTNLTENLEVPFGNELNDMPRESWSYGIAGWTEEDNEVLIYDRYDIWAFDPQGKRDPWKLTHDLGRANNTRFRIVDLSPDVRHVETDKPMVLSSFNEATKESGFYDYTYSRTLEPLKKMEGDYRAFIRGKAMNSDALLLSTMTFETYPDVWISNTSFENPTQISHLQTQIDSIAWGSNELSKYWLPNGDEMPMTIHYPPNFDKSKQYPMIVYFYERTSDRLHNFNPIKPSRSVISPSLYTSNGYIVMMPDIKYETGYPGKGGLDAVVAATREISKRGFVDTMNMAIQGQSWGGYQVAYIVTQTDMFKCGMAGAPVSNMLSAYGGIRWGSGLSRMFQYEKTQSRIGKTIWDGFDLYKENSPVFYADQVNTPLLMMHNDNDGAVPWYQGIEYFVALRRLQKPVWMLVYNREAHNLLKWPNRKDLSRRMFQFFEHHLKGAPMPVWMAEGVPAVKKGKETGFELKMTTKEM